MSLTHLATGGSDVFDREKVQKCISNTPVMQRNKYLQYYKDKNALYEATVNEAGLDATYISPGAFTICTSLDSIY